MLLSLQLQVHNFHIEILLMVAYYFYLLHFIDATLCIYEAIWLEKHNGNVSWRDGQGREMIPILNVGLYSGIAQCIGTITVLCQERYHWQKPLKGYFMIDTDNI